MTISNNQMRKMKSAARFYAVQALFQMEATAQTVEQIVREFETHRFGVSMMMQKWSKAMSIRSAS